MAGGGEGNRKRGGGKQAGKATAQPAYAALNDRQREVQSTDRRKLSARSKASLKRGSNRRASERATGSAADITLVGCQPERSGEFIRH